MLENEFEMEVDTNRSTAQRNDDAWDKTMGQLRDKFPHASDGILFCVYKLQQNPELSIRDFRDEAGLHGLALSGRSLHSAKVLLGMQKPATRRKKNGTPPPPVAAVEQNDDEDSVQGQLISVVQRIQESASSEANRLRDAMREAVTVLQRALDGRG